MKKYLFQCLIPVITLSFSTAAVQAEDAVFQRAFPNPIPTDTSFQNVIDSHPEYVQLKYPVPIIGWKNHPQEIHVTPEGALVFPEPRTPAPLYVAPLLSIGEATSSILDPDHVVTSLVDGYKPGIQSSWRTGGLKIDELAFCSLLQGKDVVTGKETLVGLARYTISNESTNPVSGSFSLNVGKAVRGNSHKVIPPTYPSPLAYSQSFLSESNGDITACVLSNSLGDLTFKAAPVGEDTGAFVLLNSGEAPITKPEYEIELIRDGDIVTVGNWHSEKGLDLYYGASGKHGSSTAVEIGIIDASNSMTRAGMIYRGGLAQDMKPVAEYVAPGENAAPVKWSELKGFVPQGKSKLSLSPYYMTANGPAKVMAWEPIVYLAQSDIAPVFKNQGRASCNSLAVAFTLAAGETKSLELAIPYFPIPSSNASQLRGLNLDSRLVDFRGYWEKELNRNTQFIIPEQRLRDAYRAWLAYNLILVDRDPSTGLLLMHPDATMYEAVWAGDGAVIMQAMDQMGYHKDVGEYANYLFSRQGSRKPDADVDNAEGFFCGDAVSWLSENGFALWALCEHYKLTGDRKWLKENAPRLIASADWIIRQRGRTKGLVNGEKTRHYGLMVKGRPSDLGDWDYWYFNDTYSYMGLKDAAEVLADAGFAKDAERIGAEAADYKACIVDSLNKSINRNVEPPFVPLTPYKNANPTENYLYQYWYHITGPIFMVEAGIFGAKDEKATWINHWVEKLGMVSGLCKFEPEVIDPHYVYNQALSQLLRGETDKFVWTLYSLYAYGQSRDTYATMEWSNLRTGIKETEAWDDCRQPHMHSNSRCLAMLRTALLLEEGDKLHLMMGTPRGWLDEGNNVEVRKAPSTFGDVSYCAKSKVAEGEIVVDIDPPAHKSANIVLHVRPPSKFGMIRSVVVNGKSWSNYTDDSIDLGKTKRKSHVVCKFK